MIRLDSHQHFWKYNPAHQVWMTDKMDVLRRDCLGIPFMLVGSLIAVLCVVVYVATTLLTPAMDPKEVNQVCWGHRLAFLKGRLAGASDPRLVTLILLAVVGGLYFLLR